MRWTFVSLESGGDIRIVTTESERDRHRERIRCGLLGVDESGIAVEHPAMEV